MKNRCQIPIDVILVPQGFEYQAICRGLRGVTTSKTLVLPVPMGIQPLTEYLETWQNNNKSLKDSSLKVLLMGLCGSLSPDYKIGDIVILKDCVYKSNNSKILLQSCDEELTNKLYDTFKDKATLVRGLTSDRIILLSNEKRQLNQIYNADVVDMEGFAALEVLNKSGVAVAMLRVISDDCHHNLPDLTSALSPSGTLQPLPLAMSLIRQPLAAMHLIQGSLKGLKVLQEVINKLSLLQ